MAALLVDSLLAERPADGERAVVILNGLGSVKYEELFVLYGNVSRRLEDAGITIIEPEVGELVTSFDMAGVSLTLAWLDPELEQLWAAPCSTPAFRKGSLPTAEQAIRRANELDVRDPAGPRDRLGRVAGRGRRGGRGVRRRRQGCWRSTPRNWAGIDAVAGDGDHGIGMQRGSAAAAEAVHELDGAGVGTTLRVAADAWSDRAGGTSGALWGIALRALADAIGDETEPSPETIAEALADARDGIVRFGKAKVGDKTMLDVLVPVVEAAQAGRWAELPRIAEQAAAATADLVPKIGRARPHADKSVGTPDAGAVSLALVIKTVMEVHG